MSEETGSRANIFKKLDKKWWDPEGEESLDHRVPLFRKQLRLTTSSLEDFTKSEKGQELLKTNPFALDVASGRGRFTEVLIKLGWQTTSFDISTMMIEESKKKHPEAHYLLADALKMPLPNDRFSVVTAIGISMHVGNLKNLLSELKRMMINEGILAINIDNYESLYALWERINPKRKNMHKSPVNRYKENDVGEIMKDVGLKIKDVLPVGTIPPISLASNWKYTIINGKRAESFSDFLDKFPSISQRFSHSKTYICQKTS